jgi:hypothetical protein
MNSKSYSRAGPKRKRRLLQHRSQELRFLVEYHFFAGVQTTSAGTKPMTAIEVTSTITGQCERGPSDWRHDEVDIRDRCFDFLERGMRDGCSLKGGESSAPPSLILISLWSKTARKGYHLSPLGCGCGRMSAARSIHAFAGQPVRVGRPTTKRNAAGHPVWF